MCFDLKEIGLKTNKELEDRRRGGVTFVVRVSSGAEHVILTRVLVSIDRRD